METLTIDELRAVNVDLDWRLDVGADIEIPYPADLATVGADQTDVTCSTWSNRASASRSSVVCRTPSTDTESSMRVMGGAHLDGFVGESRELAHGAAAPVEGPAPGAGSTH